MEADCTGGDGPALDSGLTLSEVDRLVTATPAATGATTCFRDAAGGHWVHLPATGGRPPVTVVGAQHFLTNGVVTVADNAAVALRLLGQSDHLVWYVPTVRDVAVDDTTLPAPLAPAWVQPALWLLGSAVLALCLWRGRRLGRLVVEPLPVVVRAVETTESRGRLYRRARDRGRAVAVLQAATTRRLTSYLGLRHGHRRERGGRGRRVGQRAPVRRRAAPARPRHRPGRRQHAGAGHHACRTGERGTPQMTDVAVPTGDHRVRRLRPRGPAARPARGGQGRRRPGRRRLRPARRAALPAGTSCSRACPAWPRRCWCARWRRRWTSRPSGCSSPPT